MVPSPSLSLKALTVNELASMMRYRRMAGALLYSLLDHRSGDRTPSTAR